MLHMLRDMNYQLSVTLCSDVAQLDMICIMQQYKSMCIPNVPAHPSYTIIATDGDAIDEINTTAPVTILGVVVPEYTVILSNSTAPETTPTGLSLPGHQPSYFDFKHYIQSLYH